MSRNSLLEAGAISEVKWQQRDSNPRPTTTTRHNDPQPTTRFKLQIWRLLRAKSYLTFRKAIECGLTLKLVRDMKLTYSQMNRTDKYSQNNSIIWPVWLNG